MVDEGHTGLGTGGPLISIYNTGFGLGAADGGNLSSNSPILSFSNGQFGLSWNVGSSGQLDGPCYIECSGASGVYLAEADLYINGGHIWKNTGDGVYAINGSRAFVLTDFGATTNANGAGSVYSSSGSNIQITGSTNVGTCSPAVNTVGNGNAYIQN